MRPLLLPGLLDAARAQRRARHAGRCALFESAHVYRAPSGAARRARRAAPSGATPRERAPPHRRAAHEAPPATWRSAAAPADFYAAKGLLEALLAPLGRRAGGSSRASGRSCTRAGRRRCSRPTSASSAGSASCIRSSRATWDLPGARGVRARRRPARRAADPGPAPYQDVTTFPAVLQDIAVVVGADVPAADVEARVREAGGDLLASAARVRRLHGRAGGRGRSRWRCGSSSGRPDRTLTDEDVAARRDAIEAALGEIGGQLRG